MRYVVLDMNGDWKDLTAKKDVSRITGKILLKLVDSDNNTVSN